MESEIKEIVIGVSERYEQELLVETTVDTSERGGADKVLSLEAEVKSTSTELLAGEAEIGGKVNYRVLYLDNQGRLCGLDYFKDFKCRVAGEVIKPDGKADVTFEVPDAEARLEGDKMELSAVVQIAVLAFGERKEKALASLTEAEVRTKEIASQRVVTSERTTELEKVADVGVGVKKIVLFDAKSVITGTSSEEDGSKVLKGEVRATVLYLNEADEPVELAVTLPFSERQQNAEAVCEVEVKNARIVLTDDEEGGSIEVEVTLLVKELAWESETLTLSDAAIGKKVRVIESPVVFESESVVGKKCFEQTLKGSTEIAEEDLYVVAVRPGCHAIAGVEVSEGKIKVEGVAAFRVILKGKENYSSVQLELPFACTFDHPEAPVGESAIVSLKVTGAKATYDGKEIALEASACFEITLLKRESFSFLSEAVAGDPLPESEAGISVYFAEKGEEVWGIARAMNALPSELLQTDPTLSEPLTENKKVLIFRKK